MFSGVGLTYQTWQPWISLNANVKNSSFIPVTCSFAKGESLAAAQSGTGS